MLATLPGVSHTLDVTWFLICFIVITDNTRVKGTCVRICREGRWRVRMCTFPIQFLVILAFPVYLYWQCQMGKLQLFCACAAVLIVLSHQLVCLWISAIWCWALQITDPTMHVFLGNNIFRHNECNVRRTEIKQKGTKLQEYLRFSVLLEALCVDIQSKEAANHFPI